jgi:hypothetical protein
MPRAAATYRVLIRQVAGAIILNGTNQYVNLSNTGPISTTTGPFTVSARFRRTAFPGVIAVLGDRAVGALQHFQINVNSAYRDTSVCTTSGGGTGILPVTPRPIFGWEDSTIRYDGVNVTLFRKGQIYFQTARTGTVSAPAGSMAIGSGNGSARFWQGLVCELRFWARALTDLECLRVFQGVNDSAIRTGLAGEWNLSSDVDDSVGTNDGTAVNSPTFTSTDVPYSLRDPVSGRVASTNRTLIT